MCLGTAAAAPATKAINAMIAIGARCIRKSLNDRFARLPMMMFGGSPISVDTPPMLDASTSAIMKGTGLMSRRSHTSSVTGAMSSTMVTFGSSGRRHGGDQDQKDHHPQRGTTGPLGCPDRGVLEHARLAEHADHHHRAQQQKDYVPVDSGLARVEHVVGADNPECQHDRRPAEGDLDLVDAVGRDQRVGDDENSYRYDRHWTAPG